jgi:hypothetical protein
MIAELLAEFKEVSSLSQLFYTILAAIIVQAIAGFAAWYQSKKNGSHLQEMKVSLDGRLQELLTITRLEAEAKGVILGTAAEHQRGEGERRLARSESTQAERRSDQADRRADQADQRADRADKRDQDQKKEEL